MKELHRLASTFFRTRLWEIFTPFELFAVDLGDDTGFCWLMKGDDGTVLLSIFIGSEGFSSYRKSMISDSDYSLYYLEQDALECYLFPKGVLNKAKEEKALKMFPGVQIEDCVPVFCRLRPFTAPVSVEADPDKDHLASVLQALIRLADLLKTGKKTKADLGFREIFAFPKGLVIQESGKPRIVGDQERTTVPLLLKSKSGVRVGQVELPPIKERVCNPPTKLNDPAFTRLLETEKKGEYEVDLIHYPRLQEGDPPFYPEALVLSDRSRVGHLYAILANTTRITDTDSLLVALAENLLKDGISPASVRYRDLAVKTMLKPLFDRVGIKMRKVKYLDCIDMALESICEKAEPENVKLLEKSSVWNILSGRIGFSAEDETETVDLVSRIPELEISPFEELLRLDEEALIDLLIRHHNELSPFLIRKLYRVLTV